MDTSLGSENADPWAPRPPGCHPDTCLSDKGRSRGRQEEGLRSQSTPGSSPVGRPHRAGSPWSGSQPQGLQMLQWVFDDKKEHLQSNFPALALSRGHSRLSLPIAPRLVSIFPSLIPGGSAHFMTGKTGDDVFKECQALANQQATSCAWSLCPFQSRLDALLWDAPKFRAPSFSGRALGWDLGWCLWPHKGRDSRGDRVSTGTQLTMGHTTPSVWGGNGEHVSRHESCSVLAELSHVT